METTLQPEQYVLVDKLTPRWAPYERGDIVVFQPPKSFGSSTGAPFIKRVIGLPGDRIDLMDGFVIVNGTELDEPYLFERRGEPEPTEPSGGTDELARARRRPVRHGRPSRRLRGLARLRPDRHLHRARPGPAALLAARHLRADRATRLPGARAGLTDRSAVRVEPDRERAVVDELDGHLGAERGRSGRPRRRPSRSAAAKRW